jgi:hypothetical protein
MTSTSEAAFVMVVLACPLIGYAAAVGLTLLASSIMR